MIDYCPPHNEDCCKQALLDAWMEQDIGVVVNRGYMYFRCPAHQTTMRLRCVDKLAWKWVVEHKDDVFKDGVS